MSNTIVCSHPGLAVVNGCPLEKGICCEVCDVKCSAQCINTQACKHRVEKSVKESK